MTGAGFIPPERLIAFVDGNHTGGGGLYTTIAPELARQLLDRYTEATRPLSEQLVNQYAFALTHPDPEGGHLGHVTFAPDGTTVAGKHILHAVIRTGVSASVWVTVNWVPPGWDVVLPPRQEGTAAQ